jgi:hypothetical protein
MRFEELRSERGGRAKFILFVGIELFGTEAQHTEARAIRSRLESWLRHWTVVDDTSHTSMVALHSTGPVRRVMRQWSPSSWRGG